jgi:hypothetical protein
MCLNLECLYLLDGITAGLFMIIFVLATLNSPLCSAAIISLTDFNSLATTVDVEEVLEFHFTKFS